MPLFNETPFLGSFYIVLYLKSKITIVFRTMLCTKRNDLFFKLIPLLLQVLRKTKKGFKTFTHRIVQFLVYFR